MVYVKELTALDASRQREILRQWMARSEFVSPSSLADEYEEFVITAVRDRPKVAPSGLSPQVAEAARKLPRWTVAAGALPVVVVLVLVLANLGRRSAPPAPAPTVATKAVALQVPSSQPSVVVVVQPTATVIDLPKKLPPGRAIATTPAVVQPISAPVSDDNTELVANSEFGDRK